MFYEFLRIHHIMENWVNWVLLSVLGIFFAITSYVKWKYSYWKRKGVYQIEPDFLFGNMRKLFLGKISMTEQYGEIYNQMKAKGQEYGGGYMMTRPFFMPISLTLIKNILVKDFNHFTDHAVFKTKDDDPLAAHLFSLSGDKWKKMRVQLTPTFTSSKMKMMFHTLIKCTDGLVDLVDSYEKTNEPVDTKEVLGRFTTDIIGRAAFGLECNSLRDPDSEFRKYGNKYFDRSRLKSLAMFSMPKIILKLFGVKLIPQDVEEFFLNVLRNTISYREKNNVTRDDFLQLLIRLKNGQNVDDSKSNPSTTKNFQNAMTFNELAAQCFVFFVAGFETSSTLMTFALYELSQSQDIQEETRKNINDVLAKHDGNLTYQAVMEMTYLEKVLNETLRLHTPLGFIFRVCTKSYKIPDTDIVIDRGTPIQVSTYGIHMDPEYYPNPEVFDPERFSQENKSKRPDYTFLPFGEGPRLCIGLRFGLMQAKIGMITLLRNYNITLNSKTKTPIKLSPTSGISSIDGGVWLTCKKL